MVFFQKLLTQAKAALQLGPSALVPFASYRLRVKLGLVRQQTPPGGRRQPANLAAGLQPLVQPAPAAQLRTVLGATGVAQLLAEADAARQGRARLFEGPVQKLDLRPPSPLQHWLEYHSYLPDGSDIKPVWEAGRFGWALRLAQAYWLKSDNAYAEAFWQQVEQFCAANPVNLGPHWSSAQEVALRLIHWAYAYSLLAQAPASLAERQALLAESIAQHAERIVPTLDYAYAQNNNHLLSEGLGLATAAALLPKHPRAADWAKTGWQAFQRGIARQVHADGSYAQHSSNYHRLLLSLASWAHLLAERTQQPMPPQTSQRLTAAVHWLQALLDPDSGQVPNLGPNDGAYILRLSHLGYADFRPVVQAASQAVSSQAALPAGSWDDLGLWLGQPRSPRRQAPPAQPLRLQAAHSWAYLRAAKFRERPGHADQLHLDLWWRGHNLAADPGTYLYTAKAPWDNALTGSAVHNTLTIDGRDQMTRAGRFLWLDWAQAQVLHKDYDRRGRLQTASAVHNGYAHLGLRHQRSVTTKGAIWTVEDEVSTTRLTTDSHRVRLHWLLPDWPWELQGSQLALQGPEGTVLLSIYSDNLTPQVSLLRAGQRLAGPAEPQPTLGWASPTYASKQPALALLADFDSAPPLRITSRWTLPD